MEVKVSTVGDFTPEHARRILMLSYRIWKRHLQEQANKEESNQPESKD
ncbi:hypothetical protein [Alicyclobacillus pomorum]|nr:hypothetical protein [Alicyclobacillus pomorum]